jgi:esterase/lipase superfamily enzyme
LEKEKKHMADGYERIENRELGKAFEIIRYGVNGPPIIVFPTSRASAWQFEHYGMPGDCARLLKDCRLQFFSITGYNSESWSNHDIAPQEKIARALAYERFVCDTLAPHIVDIAKNDRLGAVGCSFGGYYSFHFAAKFPHLFKTGISFMGVFDLKFLMNGFYNNDFYFCNPADYLANMTDPYYLNKYASETILALIGGENDKFHYENRNMHDILLKRNIRHVYEIWRAPCDHHEYWWKQQLPWILDRLY